MCGMIVGSRGLGVFFAEEDFWSDAGPLVVAIAATITLWCSL